MTKFQKYIKSLDERQQRAYARRAGTTLGYLINHLYYARKVPRDALMTRLADKSQGRLKKMDILRHFHGLERAA